MIFVRLKESTLGMSWRKMRKWRCSLATLWDSGIHQPGGWEGARANMDSSDKREGWGGTGNLDLPWIRSWFLSCQTWSLVPVVIYWMLHTHHSLQKAQSKTPGQETIILNSTCEKYILQKMVTRSRTDTLNATHPHLEHIVLNGTDHHKH
jgi:hypothetical protein